MNEPAQAPGTAASLPPTQGTAASHVRGVPPTRSADGLVRGGVPGTWWHRGGSRFIAVGLLLVGLVGAAWWLITPQLPRTLSEVPLAQLVPVEGRLVLRSATDIPFTGWMTEQYADGALKSRSRVIEGLLDGVSEGWHPDGRLQVREHFVAGVAEGPVTKWHANGVRLSEGVAREGRIEGVFRRWHADGMLAEAVTLRDGRPDGLSRAWFPSGQLRAEVLLEHGEVIRQRFWSDGEQPGLAATATRGAPPKTRQTP